MLSISNFHLLNENLILNDFLGSDQSMDGIEHSSHGYFSPPGVALMNSLRTPQLEFSEMNLSDDYNLNQERAKNGFSDEETIYSQKFKIDEDE